MIGSSIQKVCLICGLGGGGIGDNVAKKFSSEGYKVAMLARSKEKLLALEKQIPNSKGYVCDASDSVAVHTTVSHCIEDLGGVDVLVFNVGSGAFKSFDETTEEEFENFWSSGPKGLFSFAKALMPHFLSKETGGVIGVTGATASWRGMPTTSAFASSKFATRGLCQSLSREFGPKNVHVFHVVIDGIVDLPKTRQWMPNKPKSEFIDPAHIADLYWYLSQQDKRCWTYEVSVGPGDVAGSMAEICNVLGDCPAATESKLEMMLWDEEMDAPRICYKFRASASYASRGN